MCGYWLPGLEHSQERRKPFVWRVLIIRTLVHTWRRDRGTTCCRHQRWFVCYISSMIVEVATLLHWVDGKCAVNLLRAGVIQWLWKMSYRSVVTMLRPAPCRLSVFAFWGDRSPYCRNPVLSKSRHFVADERGLFTVDKRNVQREQNNELAKCSCEIFH